MNESSSLRVSPAQRSPSSTITPLAIGVDGRSFQIVTVSTEPRGRMISEAAWTVFDSNPSTSPATTPAAPSPVSANACDPLPPRAIAAISDSS